MHGRALLWSVTHYAHSSAASWVQAIIIYLLHNFRISLGEVADDEKQKSSRLKIQPLLRESKGILP